MKLSMYGLDLFYLLKELDFLKNSKVSKLSQFSKNQLVFSLFCSGKGKHDLMVSLPSAIYLCKNKNAPEKVPQFCQSLRKYLLNTILKDIAQVGLERVVEFTFQSKDKKYILIIELFSKGNLILCDEAYKIILPLSSQTWKDRSIKKGVKYRFPSAKVNPFKLKDSEFEDIVYSSKKENIVKTLALDLAVGGKYAEELCLLSDVKKTAKNVTPKQLSSLFTHLKDLKDKKLDPQLVLEDSEIIDIIPFKMGIYPNCRSCRSFSSAIEKALSVSFTSKFEKKIAQIKKIIESLEENIEELESSYESNTKKGEILYEQYQLLNKVLSQVQEASRSSSLQELKKKLKKNPLVKDIIPDKQIVVVDL